MTAALANLNPAALVTLADCEQRIERGLKTFIDVGQALTEIRDSRLYRATHETFEAYLEQRWQMSRSYAHRMIAAAEVVLPIGNTDLPAPTNEGQARALGKVPEAERADVWREAVERTDGKPTAAAVREVHEERTRPTSPGPSGAAHRPPAGSGSTPAPAAESPVLVPPQEPASTPAPADVASTAPAGPGSGEVAAPREGGAAAMPPPGSPATWTDEQVEANRREVERKAAIAAAERFAESLVLEVRGMVTTIIDGIDFGAPCQLVTAEMIAECRSALDRLEARVAA